MKKPLRSGYTTGACAAAAAKGAAQMLADQAFVSEVSINLPAGTSATFQLHGQRFSTADSSCYVIKDAGDDPDVTNGAEVWATVRLNPLLPPFIEGGSKISITGGTGIGKVTKPGLAIPPGEWAINPVPRRMIEEAVGDVLSTFNLQPSTFNVVISIPDGEQRAKKTLNQRLGIIGGLSILGTTGIVRPVSAKAWTDTIDSALDVARACGSETVVLSTGRTSELAAQAFLNHFPPPLTGGGWGVGGARTVDNSGYAAFPPTLTHPRQGGGDLFLPEEAFIMMGDHLAYALRACARRGFTRPVIACQFAKLLKIACGHENTHAAASELDLASLREWAEKAALSSGIIAIIVNANTAREIAITGRFDSTLVALVTTRAGQATVGHAPGIAAHFLVCGYDGNVVWS